MTMRNANENLATEGGITLLRRIFQLLKPLGVVTGGGSNRLSVDVNSVTGVSTVNNQANMGGVSAFELMKAMSRTAYNSGVRANIT